MKILAIAKLVSGKTIEELLQHQATEAAKVWETYKSGLLREIYLHYQNPQQPGAVLIFEAADVEEVKAAVSTFPMVAAGVLHFDFYPLGPFLSYEMLFAK